jgi:hypothetical protein
MAKMKVEFLSHYKAKHGFTLKDRLVAYLPDYADAVSRIATLSSPLACSMNSRPMASDEPARASEMMSKLWGTLSLRVRMGPSKGSPIQCAPPTEPYMLIYH